MKNTMKFLTAGLLLACGTANLAQGHRMFYSEPVYSTFYEPVTYETVRTYRQVVEEVPVRVSRPVLVQRAYPVRTYRTYRPCRRHYCRPYIGFNAYPSFGGFNFSIGF